MKPIWKSRKVWIAVISLLVIVVAHYTGSGEIADAVALLGAVLVGAFGLSDLGKEGAAVKSAADLAMDDTWRNEVIK